MQVIVAHPGRQHSFRLASALKKAGMLDLYVTTFYDKDTRANRAFRAALPVSLRSRAGRRRNPDLDDAEVRQLCTLGGIAEAAVYRLDHGRDLYRFVQRRNADRFGRKLAKLACARQADAVVLYDSTATACFESLRRLRPETVRILDVSSCARPYKKQLFETEIARSGHDDLRRENGALWSERLLERHREELRLADAFLVPSAFVRESLVRCGVEAERIFTVPYGANVADAAITRGAPAEGEPVRFLFVGGVNANKGAALLLDAFAALPAGAATLTLTGRYDPDAWFVRRARELPGVRLTGAVPPERMRQVYAGADVFVLPSLTEGLSQAGVEAMACALPIVCTDHTGVNDYVRDGVSGFVIPAGDPQALAEKLRWCVDHRERLPEMGAAARAAVSGLTWEAYETKASETIRTIIKQERGNADG